LLFVGCSSVSSFGAFDILVINSEQENASPENSQNERPGNFKDDSSQRAGAAEGLLSIFIFMKCLMTHCI
jgi:hypothetical protein